MPRPKRSCECAGAGAGASLGRPTIENLKPIAIYIYIFRDISVTYDHRLKTTGHPVRSAIHKLQIDGLVVGWVTTSEFPLLYVKDCFFLAFTIEPVLI